MSTYAVSFRTTSDWERCGTYPRPWPGPGPRGPVLTGTPLVNHTAPIW